MSLGSSSPKVPLDNTCTNIRKAEDQPCNNTDDNLGSDCYESMHAFKKIRTSTSGLRKSPNKWTKEENQKLAALVSSYGEKKWKRISAEMGGQKTGAQCAQHWKRVLSPEIRKGHWDENEEDLLLRLVVQYGSCWKKIAKKIPQRTDIQCRYQYLKAKQSREVMWDAKEDESLMKKVMEMANCNFFQVLNSDGVNPATNASTTTSIPSPAPSLSPSSDMSNSPSMKSINNNSPLFASSPLRNSHLYNLPSPMLSSPTASRPISIINRERENEDTNSSGLSSSSGSESNKSEEDYRMKMSGEFSKDSWNDDKHNVNMSDSSPADPNTIWRSSSGGINNSNNSNINILSNKDAFSDRLCANCRSPFINHINKVVWLEISEHMARLKLTSTLRTALECKTRFTELLGNKMSFGASAPAPTPFNLPPLSEGKPTSLKNSGDLGRERNGFTLPHPLGGSGGIGMGGLGGLGGTGLGGMGIGNSENIGIKGFHNSLSDASNIGIKINNNNNNNSNNNNNINKTTPGNNINLTNCNNNNITINITNSYTTNTSQNGINFQQITHSHSAPSSSSSASSSSSSVVPPLKTESLLGPSHLLSKANTILSPAPPFPSFSHLSHPSFPHLPQPSLPKPAPRIVPSGLESLAAVASILPREMLADYF